MRDSETKKRRGGSSRARLTLLAAGVIVLHTLVTILEEHLFSLEAFTQSAGGAFMTLCMYFGAIVVYLPIVASASDFFSFNLSVVASASQQRSGVSTSRGALFRVSTIYVGTTTLTKTSLRYIDMPTQTVLKSAKLLPVMAGSILILGKSYSRREWLAAVALCAGIAIFNCSTNFPEPQQTLAGAACIGIALMCDALLGNYQKVVLSQGVSVSELMLYQSASGFMYMLLVTISDGTLIPGLRLLAHDRAVAFTLLAWAVAITAGTALVLRLVDEYSAVVAIVVTTVRKALTLFASFVLFPKHFGLGHPIGAALVFGSAFITMGRRKRKTDAEDDNGAGLLAACGTGTSGGDSAVAVGDRERESNLSHRALPV